MGTITVVVPVFQGVEFLAAAVRSALGQPEVERVVIVDDGSTDGSWEVARSLEGEYRAVSVVSHPGRENRGVSAARNRGVREASTPYLAFLDADDYYLPERFSSAIPLLESDLTAGGVYEPVGVSFSNDDVRSFWFHEMRRPSVSWTGRAVPPEELFEHLCTRRHFHIAGVTLRRDVFLSSGGFNPALSMSEDTELWLKLALCSRLVAGSERVVAIRRVHGANTIIQRRAERDRHGELKWRHVARWAAKRRLPRRVMNVIGSNVVQSIVARHRTERGTRLELLRDVASAAYAVPTIALTTGYWSRAVRCCWQGIGGAPNVRKEPRDA